MTFPARGRPASRIVAIPSRMQPANMARAPNPPPLSSPSLATRLRDPFYFPAMCREVRNYPENHP